MMKSRSGNGSGNGDGHRALSRVSRNPAYIHPEPVPAIRLRFVAAVILALLSPALGCRREPGPEFPANRAYIHVQEQLVGDPITPERLADVSASTVRLFGTPDEPALPTNVSSPIEEVLELAKIQVAAGPVPRNQKDPKSGFYRQQCTGCHGVGGDGAGSEAARHDPYPRDYRRGTFKYKSTPLASRPTHDDLTRTVRRGVPDTAMPSFSWMPDETVDALVHYVKYLAVRGEVERSLTEQAADLDVDTLDALDTSAENLDRTVSAIVRRWHRAETEVPEVPPRLKWTTALDKRQAVQRGRKMFYGETATCAKCHDDEKLKQGLAEEYDDWAREFLDWGKETDPNRRQAKVDAYVALGGLPPQRIRSRNLTQGVFRGGDRPEDIYRRILNGISGVSMPAAPMKAENTSADSVGLVPGDVWDLVEYVLALPELGPDESGPPEGGGEEGGRRKEEG